MRALVLRAVRARGALTESGIAEHYRRAGPDRRGAPSRRGAGGRAASCERLAVDDGGPPVLVPGGQPLEERVAAGATLLSPFDNLLWDRPFAERLFGFRHVMEIYKPAPQRVYGYYVLPLLRGDRIVGRADLKSDRKAGELRVLALHREPGVRGLGGASDDVPLGSSGSHRPPRAARLAGAGPPVAAPALVRSTRAGCRRRRTHVGARIDAMTSELDHRDGPRDECGVFGVYAPESDVARLAYFALYALQHRGQESAGIATGRDGHIMTVRDLGLVSQVFDEEKLRALDGQMAVGPRALLHHRVLGLGERPAGLALGPAAGGAGSQREPDQRGRAAR